MRKNRVLILTEGGRSIGFGHVTRCEAIYGAFKARGMSPYFIVNGDNSVRNLLRGRRCSIFNWIKERNKLFAAIKDSGIVVVDSYLAGLAIYKEISMAARIPVYIDDNKRIDYPRGIIINGSVYARRLKYPKSADKFYILGPEYALLRRAFRTAAKRQVRKSIKKVLVTFGGDDACDMTPGVLKLLAGRYPRIYKDVCIGGGFKNIKAIEKAADKRTRLIFRPDEYKMNKAMRGADIAVSGGGQTLYELAKTGTPTIAFLVAGNQVNNIRGWSDTGFIRYAGCCRKAIGKLPGNVDAMIPQSVRARMGMLGMKLVDGMGADRIVDTILGAAGEIGLRRAAWADGRDIWLWRNHEAVRRWSFTGSRISHNDHTRWFKDKLKCRSCFIYIAYNKIMGKLGQVRFDKCAGGLAKININLNPRFMGMGLGHKIIKKATEIFVKDMPGVKKVVAEVISGNAASKKAFLKAGYRYSHGFIREKIRISVFEF